MILNGKVTIFRGKTSVLRNIFSNFAGKIQFQLTKMMKRILFLAVLIAGFALPSKAVLKEDSLESTLRILRQELIKYHDEYSARQAQTKNSRLRVISTIIQETDRANQNALMLYSQKDGFVFDLTYACHEATEQYKEFEKKIKPFKAYVSKGDVAVARYDSLINSLRTMRTNRLTERGKIDRSVCLAMAVNTRRMLVENQQQLTENIYMYNRTEEKLRNLNDYANKRYKEIQDNIFKNGGDSYFTILSRFGDYIVQTKESIDDKYFYQVKGGTQWDPRLIGELFIGILIYGIIAILLNQLIVRWLATKLIRRGKFGRIGDWFLAKRTCIILASTAVTFAISLGILRLSSNQNFTIMAADLLVEFAWLLSVVLISILLRVKAEQTISTFRVYAPLLFNGFIVISFRIILIPNHLVNLIFPPILLACCLWQWSVIRRHNQNIERSDVVYAYISQLVFVVSLISSMVGYTLLSVQILIWWIMQLTCILTITCIRDWFKEYSKIKKIEERPVTENWYYRLFYWVFLPTCSVCSVLISFYWAADVFNLTAQTIEMFRHKYIDFPNFQASISTVCMVIIIWFVFNYINQTLKQLVALYLYKSDASSAESRLVMIKNVLQVVVWGVWFIVSLALFHVGSQWLVIITGGLSTGIGFASKEILENIYYGIALMTGRVKIGDLIVCDGIRGKVTSISYTSTMVTAVDGSVIAFTNSQLFTKNYQNMTRNHGYERHVLDVGVAYGTNIGECKKVLTEALSQLDCINQKKGISIVLKELGDSALVLKVIVWVSVYTGYGDDGKILECIYNTLNQNNIEIPFPQTDVHMK